MADILSDAMWLLQASVLPYVLWSRNGSYDEQ